MDPTTTDCGVMVTLLVLVVPAALVTVRTYVVGMVKGCVTTDTPDVAAPIPLSMAPEPFEKVGVRTTVPPYFGESVSTSSAEATGTGTTFTVATLVAEVPAWLVTLSV
jgi:hypothetical protein